MLEPLRQEIDQPSAARVLLRRPFGRILLGHVAVPMAVLAAGAASPACGVAVAGALPARGGAIAAAAVAVVPAIVLCAALSSRRGGRLPVSVLAMGTTGDPSGGGIVVAWLLAWPAAAVALGALPLVFVARAHALGSALVLAFAVAGTAPFILAQVLAPRALGRADGRRGALPGPGAEQDEVVVAQQRAPRAGGRQALVGALRRRACGRRPSSPARRRGRSPAC